MYFNILICSFIFQALHLDDNNIDTVASATFMSLERLEVLTLAQNRLHGLTPRMFYLLSNLRTLDLSGNPIRELEPDVLKDLPMLRTLRCARCSITRVKSLVYKNIPELETLDLHDNHISSLAPEEYMDLKYLKFLYLDGNRILEIKDYTFKALGLQYLGLSNNHMEKISRMGFEDSSVMDLDLSFNKLGFSSLRHLNPIIGHIHDLKIGGNHLKVDQLHELLNKAVRLKKLDISHLHLKQIPPNLFNSQVKLENLNLSSNGLMFIPVDILHSLPSLRVLDLKKNNIRGLPEIILRRLDRLQDIHLEHNPWSCDQCHIPHLKVWLNNSKTFREGCQPDVDAPKCLKCQAPMEMYDKPIIEVDGLELQPCPEGTFDLAAASAGSSGFTLILAVVTATLVVVLLIVILIVGIIMYNRHSAFYYTHENDTRHHFYDNPALHSNHTDITMDGDPDELPDREVLAMEHEHRSRRDQSPKCFSTPTNNDKSELQDHGAITKGGRDRGGLLITGAGRRKKNGKTPENGNS